MAGTVECPAPGCSTQIGVTQHACPRDFERLPYELRRALHETRGRSDWPAYDGAVTAALAWWRGHIGVRT